MKKVISACIDRVLEFDTQNEAAKYLEKMCIRDRDYHIQKEATYMYRIIKIGMDVHLSLIHI